MRFRGSLANVRLHDMARVAFLVLALVGAVSAICTFIQLILGPRLPDKLVNCLLTSQIPSHPPGDTYKVQAGESAVSIADKLQLDYDEFLSALQSCMGFVEGSVLQVGQAICLPPYTPSCRFVSETGECTRYTVQYGDTLSIISSNFNIDMEELASVNNLNLTTPVRPNTRLVIPPAGEGCGLAATSSTTNSPSEPIESTPQESPSPIPEPSKDVTGKECRMWLSSGGETIASIAEANEVDVGELKRANGDKYPKSTDITEPGAFVYLPPFDSKCKEEDVVVVNRPSSGGGQGGQVQVPVGASPPPTSSSTPTSSPVTDVSPSPAIAQGDLAPGPSPSNATQNDPVNRLVVDVFMINMSESQFKDREYVFRENMAYASNISVVDVEVRFSLSVKSMKARRLLQGTPEYFKVNTALFGDESSIYNALTSSIDLGVFPEMMGADGLNISYVTAMYPDQVTLYDAQIDPNTVEQANEASEAFYAPLSLWTFVGICVGGGVAAILLVAGLAYCVSRRKRKANEKKLMEAKTYRQKEVSKYRKIVQETGVVGGAGKGSLAGGKTSRPSEIRIDAYSASLGAGRPSIVANGARDASVAPDGDRDASGRSFTRYLLDSSAETPRYSTATPRRDDNSMGQELTRRASSLTESARETGREAIITPKLPSSVVNVTPKSAASNRDRVTPKSQPVANTSTREYSPTRRTASGTTPRASSFTGRQGSSPRRSSHRSYAEF